MDLGAYAQIDDLSAIAKENGIYVPRLRGYRMMMDQERVADEEMARIAKTIAMDVCDMIVRTGSDCCWCNFGVALKRVKRYLVLNGEGDPVEVKWDNVHGKLRKRLKFEIKKATKSVKRQYGKFNEYCGQNVLYIHSRIGGNNWSYYCNEVKDHPWFIEKVDDAFDSTYCDIYARLKNEDCREKNQA